MAVGFQCISDPVVWWVAEEPEDRVSAPSSIGAACMNFEVSSRTSPPCPQTLLRIGIHIVGLQDLYDMNRKKHENPTDVSCVCVRVHHSFPHHSNHVPRKPLTFFSILLP